MGRSLLAATAVPLVWLGACAGPLNHESSIGDPESGGVELGTINPDAPRPYSDSGLYDGSPWDRAAGSLTGIERDNWAQQDFRVPIDGTSHQPTYSVHPDYANGLARERGLYPDATTALDLRGDDTHRLQALEAVAAPFYSGLDIALWIPRAFLAPPGSTVQSPGTAYERAPRYTETWVVAVPPKAPAAEPAATPPEPAPESQPQPEKAPTNPFP